MGFVRQRDVVGVSLISKGDERGIRWFRQRNKEYDSLEYKFEIRDDEKYFFAWI